MLTRCPECNTTFRVTPEQLKARAGDVRCGACQNVFNALDTLVDEATAVFVEPPAPAPATAAAVVRWPDSDLTAAPGPRPSTATQAETPDAGLPLVSPPTDSAQALPHAGPAALPEASAPSTDSSGELPIPSSRIAAIAPPGAPTRVPPAIVPVHAVPAPPPQTVATALPSALVASGSEVAAAGAALLLWGGGCLLACFAVALQLAVALRTEIAVLYPAVKPVLTELCAVVGCDLPFPRKAELVGIEASDLHPDATGKGKLAMVATLKNRAPFVQEYPFLELTLTDTGDQPLVRRVIPPKEYLRARTLLANGFPAGAELAVNLAIDADGVAAAGYRLYLFYP